MNGFGSPETWSWRGGSGKVASSSSVRALNIIRRGPWSPTQVVTIRPAASKVTDAQSATWKLELRFMSRPSGPNQRLRSVCQASTCRLLSPLGAMNGCRGGSVAVSGLAVAGEPVNLVSAPASGPSWIGVPRACAAATRLSTTAAVNERRLDMAR